MKRNQTWQERYNGKGSAELTPEEWHGIATEFRTVIEGQRMTLWNDPRRGTMLIPVTLIQEGGF